MKKIKLTKGKYALVDDTDYDWLNRWKWHLNSEGYAARSDYKNHRCIRMHRAIIDASAGEDVDHRNGNRLDNRRGNLRICTSLQNSYNRKPNGKASKYKGVYLYIGPKTFRAWRATIGVNRCRISLGYFKKEIDAAKAYDAAARIHFGEFAYLNFTERTTK